MEEWIKAYISACDTCHRLEQKFCFPDAVSGRCGPFSGCRVIFPYNWSWDSMSYTQTDVLVRSWFQQGLEPVLQVVIGENLRSGVRFRPMPAEDGAPVHTQLISYGLVGHAVLVEVLQQLCRLGHLQVVTFRS